MKWLVALAGADAIAMALFFVPELINTTTESQLGIARVLVASVIPVVILLIVNVMSANVKAMLVYWKPLGVLPGCEAFSKYGPADQRVDMAELKRNIGALPVDSNEQNAKWYRLYKMVESKMEVAATQKEFLMYRDMAALSLPLIVLVPLALYVVGVSSNRLYLATALFLVQYILAAVSARHSGIRFVCSVLAIHAAQKITTRTPHS